MSIALQALTRIQKLPSSNISKITQTRTLYDWHTSLGVLDNRLATGAPTPVADSADVEVDAVEASDGEELVDGEAEESVVSVSLLEGVVCVPSVWPGYGQAVIYAPLHIHIIR